MSTTVGVRITRCCVLALALLLTWAPVSAQDCGWGGTPFSTGPNGPVAALASFDAGSGLDLYAGGLFNVAGTNPATNLAFWNGLVWDRVGQGVNGPVAALLPYDDGGGALLYCAGDFTQVGGGFVPAESIATWSGTTWQAVGAGLPGGVLALTSYDDGTGADLIAGGTFTIAAGAVANYLARWDGVAWTAFATAPSGPVHALTTVDLGAGEQLVAGGSFATAGVTTTNNIALWNGVSWQSLGAGTNGLVRACAAFDDGGGTNLYIGGDFTIVDGLSVNGIARWNGTNWSTLGTGVNGNVHALSVYDDGAGAGLYVGGDFALASGLSAPRIARWRSSLWELLGSGITGSVVSAFAPHPAPGEEGLYVGGSLTVAGVTPVVNVASWGGGVAPSISVDLSDQDLCAGQPLTLSVTASGATPLHYEWRRHGSVISNDVVYSVPTAAVGDSGIYDVTITNSCGQVVSVSATIVVEAQPTVSDLGDQSVCPGDPVTFMTTASGFAPLTLQWRHNGADIVGATTDTYTIATATPADAGLYELVATDPCGTTVVSALLTVFEPVQIMTQPSSTTVCPDDNVSFFVAASGNPAPTYQWYLDGTPVAGATSATYALAQALPADVGSYTVDVTNACGTVTSVQALLQLHDEVAIVTAPMGAAICTGDPLSLSVAATGTSPLTFQWFLDGVRLPGETGSGLSVAAVDGSTAGAYTVEVTNLCGSLLSPPADVSLIAVTAITTAPAGLQQCEGTPATLEVIAVGDSLTYQWLLDGVPIVGANSSQLVFAALTAADTGSYTVDVSGTCGNATSTPVQVVVDLLPLVDVDPLSQSATVGDMVTLDVQASGLAPLTYQWSKDGQPLAGETATTLVIDPVQSTSGGVYAVAVTNSCGTTNSGAATLLVGQVPGPTDVSCCMDELDVTLCWTLPVTYTAIEIKRDGVTIATVAGDALCYAETLPGGGSFVYELIGTAFGELSESTFCAVQDFPAVLGLQCGIPMPAPGPQEVLVSWSNPHPYTGFEIYRDNTLVATLPAGAGLFLDTGVPDGLIQYRVDAQVASTGCVSVAASNCAVLVAAPVGFRRGDANNDLQFNVADVVFIITYLFNSGAAPLCFDAADINDDGFIDISDSIYMLLFSFSGGPPPPPPFSETQLDPTPDGLGCSASAW
ncbi:MAG: immunoglobulin domain-containing protein [Planctomycetota bacterium]